MDSKYLDIDSELTIHYQISGRGENVILLLPGWTMSTTVYEKQLEFFENHDSFRFITLDPRSHGLSSKTQNGHFYPQHGRDLHTFIDLLNIDNLVLGGWSFGTLATLAYINQFGHEKLKGFIMLDGPPCVSGTDNTTQWVTYQYDDADGSNRFYTYGQLENSSQFQRGFSSWLFEDTSEANIQWATNISRQTPRSDAALLNASASFLDYQADLADLNERMPLWYMVRESQRDIVTHWSTQHTPTARVDALGEHIMFWERSEQFNALLLQFANRCFNLA